MLALLTELLERVDNDAGVGAVVDVDGRTAHPRLQIVDRQRDVLRVRLVTKGQHVPETAFFGLNFQGWKHLGIRTYHLRERDHFSTLYI